MNFEQDLNHLYLKAAIKINEPLARHTSWKVGGPADYLIVPEDIDEIIAVAGLCKRYGVPLTVIGNGTNLLVREGGLRGVVLKIASAALQSVIREGIKIRVGAGASLPHLAGAAASWGLAGLEAIAGIPGTVGGALIMNAGAFGTYIGDLVEEVTVLDLWNRVGEIKFFNRADCRFGYRKSGLNGKGLITGVLLRLEEGDPAILKQRQQEYLRERLRRHPRQPSAGSVFRNPPGLPAGKLIEAAGGKGLQFGGAQVSPDHANFIVNLGGATSQDILALIDKTQRLVKEKFNLELHPEIRILGEDDKGSGF